MKKIVLFDIDGTILNVESSLARSIFIDTFGEMFSIDISKSIPSFHGKTDLQIIADIANLYGIDYSNEIEQIWNNIFEKFEQRISKESITILPGAAELIEEIEKADNFELGLVTGNFRKNAYLKLSLVGLDEYFPFGGFGDDCPDRNKLPLIAIERAKKSKIIDETYPISNSVIIGDTFRDIQAAKSNSLKAVAVATGKAPSSELRRYTPDVLFEDLSDYKKVFDCLNKL